MNIGSVLVDNYQEIVYATYMKDHEPLKVRLTKNRITI